MSNASYVFDGLRVNGSVEAIMQLQVRLGRLRLLEQMLSKYPGYPSYFEMKKRIDRYVKQKEAEELEAFYGLS